MYLAFLPIFVLRLFVSGSLPQHLYIFGIIFFKYFQVQQLWNLYCWE